MIRLIILSGFIFSTAYSFSAPGDTTRIRVHDAVDMVWYENYDQQVIFPEGNTSYGKILMHYTMGCASTGCSDWDYTTKIELLKPLGYNDSTVASIDTISQDPLVVDTTWNVYEAKEPFELARVITPYGGYMRVGSNGYNSNWRHVHTFDVTDYAPLFRDTAEIRAFYGGWSSGFSVTIDFEFIEGTPPREVLEVRNLWQSGGNGWGYQDATSFDNDYLQPISVEYPLGTGSSMLRVVPSGHGFDNNTSCAEFCQRNYYLKMDDTQIGSNLMWDADCGLNPIYPQGGTWLYDRANWCPGLRTHRFDHDLTGLIAEEGVYDFDIDIQNITWSGNQAPVYIWETQLFIYGEKNHQVDAAIEDIISPSNKDDYQRMNPICNEARVIIKNYGSQSLTSATLSYAVNGNNWRTYNWEGSLAFGESETVVLPITESWEWSNQGGNSTFEVRIENPNGAIDENSINDAMMSTFENTPMLPSVLEFQFRTNTKPNETTWKLFDSQGNVLKENESGMLASTLYRDTFDLTPGCYMMRIEDSAKNGLSWWANNDGSGYARLRIPSSTMAHVFKADFGTKIEYYFTVGYGLSIPEDFTQTAPKVTIYPNPSNGMFKVEFDSFQNDAAQIQIVNTMGQIVLKEDVSFNQSSLKEIEFDLSDSGAGTYFVHITTKDSKLTKHVVIY